MKIGIEGQRLFRRKKHGMDMVALELIRNLQEIDKENEYVIFVKPDEDDTVIRESENFTIIRLPGGFYPLWEQVALPRAARRYNCDILHCTSNTAPVITRKPLVVTLHDIIYMERSFLKILTGSGSWYQKLGNAYRRLVVPRVIRKSRRIITVSQFEKNRIGQFFGMEGDPRLEAVYNGVGGHFRPVGDPAELNRVRKKYNLPGRYFFFLGNTDPKKNTPGTLKAFSGFLKQVPGDFRLVMIDYERGELEKILSAIGDPGLMDKIVLTGYVVNTDLPAIYSQCEVFLYPSLRESFGIPMLEAMACGAPVVTSITSSMPEVAGDAALLVDPYKPEEITGALVRLVEDQELRSSLISKGFERAALFTWAEMARKVLEIYKQTLNQSHARS